MAWALTTKESGLVSCTEKLACTVGVCISCIGGALLSRSRQPLAVAAPLQHELTVLDVKCICTPCMGLFRLRLQILLLIGQTGMALT